MRVGAFAASDCDPLLVIGPFVAGLALLGLGSWLFFKGNESGYIRRRGQKRGLTAAGLGLLFACFGAAVYGAQAADEARNRTAADAAGFTSVPRYLAARRLGYATDGEYAAHTERQQAMMMRATDANKVDAVKAFRAEARAGREDERERLAASKAAERVKNEAAAKECRNTADCFARENMARAGFACARPVADLSESYADWVNKAQEPRFGGFRVKNLDAGVVTYIGDKIRFPNGSGGMVNQIYECDFDAEKDRVVAVRARAGSLAR